MTAPASLLRDCVHPRAAHQHGTALAFGKDGCRCAPCVLAARREAKATRYRTETGSHSYVPAEPARAHVRVLLGDLTVGQVEQRSGVHRTAIRVLLGEAPGRPPSKRIKCATAAALLAVTSDRVGAEQQGLVDSTGTRRRLQALVALGWPVTVLQGRLAMSSRTTHILIHEDSPQPVRVTTRAAVTALYDTLSLTVPPPSRAATAARRRAAGRGWPPPLAWDDDAIDDPRAQPARGDLRDRAVDDVAIDRAMAGDSVALTRAERIEASRRLTAAGRSAGQIGELLGINRRSAARHRERWAS